MNNVNWFSPECDDFLKHILRYNVNSIILTIKNVDMEKLPEIKYQHSPSNRNHAQQSMSWLKERIFEDIKQSACLIDIIMVV